MELYSKMLKPSSCIASHMKVLPSDDGVMGYEEVKIHYIINAKQNYRNNFQCKCNAAFAITQQHPVIKNLTWGAGSVV